MAHRPPNTKPPMENSTPFDLDQALSQWRARLQDLGRFRAEELDELEGHLRESISGLHTRGLAVEEALLIATRRLGSERQLSDEFAKANPQRTWTERAMWMVVGVLGAYTLAVVAAPFSGSVFNCAIWSGLNGRLAGALCFLANGIVWAVAAASVYWVFSRPSARRDHVVGVCIRQPVLTGLGLFIGLECLQYVMLNVNRLTEPVYCFFSGHHPAPNMQTGAFVDSWFVWEYFLTQLVWVAGGPLLAGYAWQRRERAASGSSVSHEVQPGGDEFACGLRGQGLSLDEASLILARRRCPQGSVAPSVGPVFDRGVWLERAIWMVTGVGLSRCLEWLVLSPGWSLVVATQPAAALAQHLVSLASTCLGLTLAGAIVAGLWKWVTRCPGQSALISSICRCRPLLTAIALVVVCAGIGIGEFALFTHVAKRIGLPAQVSIGPIAGQWHSYFMALTHVIIPIALLVWLARRWRSTQTDPEPCR
jgi:hypothetical protein